MADTPNAREQRPKRLVHFTMRGYVEVDAATAAEAYDLVDCMPYEALFGMRVHWVARKIDQPRAVDLRKDTKGERR
jgi:hypothetical protein